MGIETKKYSFPNVQIANTFFQHLMGLMGKKTLAEGCGILFLNCRRIHTNFMRFPIDIIYLNKKFEVISTETVVPWRIGKKVFGAKHIIELSKGEAQKFVLGEQVYYLR